MIPCFLFLELTGKQQLGDLQHLASMLYQVRDAIATGLHLTDFESTILQVAPSQSITQAISVEHKSEAALTCKVTRDTLFNQWDRHIDIVFVPEGFLSSNLDRSSTLDHVHQSNNTSSTATTSSQPNGSNQASLYLVEVMARQHHIIFTPSFAISQPQHGRNNAGRDQSQSQKQALTFVSGTPGYAYVTNDALKAYTPPSAESNAKCGCLLLASKLDTLMECATPFLDESRTDNRSLTMDDVQPTIAAMKAIIESLSRTVRRVNADWRREQEQARGCRSDSGKRKGTDKLSSSSCSQTPSPLLTVFISLNTHLDKAKTTTSTPSDVEGSLSVILKREDVKECVEMLGETNLSSYIIEIEQNMTIKTLKSTYYEVSKAIMALITLVNWSI